MREGGGGAPEFEPRYATANKLKLNPELTRLAQRPRPSLLAAAGVVDVAIHTLSMLAWVTATLVNIYRLSKIYIYNRTFSINIFRNC